MKLWMFEIMKKNTNAALYHITENLIFLNNWNLNWWDLVQQQKKNYFFLQENNKTNFIVFSHDKDNKTKQNNYT